MKKLIVIALALSAAASILSQGSAGTVVLSLGPGFHVWSPSSTDPALSLVGFGSNDTPSGTTPYAADGMALIGAHGTGGPYGAATTYGQLLGAVGANAPQSSLVPVGQTTTFHSGAQAGTPVSITDTLSGLPGIPPDTAFASFVFVAWDNSSGLYANWTQASAAWSAGLIAAGRCNEFTVADIGGTINPAPLLNDMGAIASFNIYYIPEPATLALAGLSAATFLVFRRRA